MIFLIFKLINIAKTDTLYRYDMKMDISIDGRLN